MNAATVLALDLSSPRGVLAVLRSGVAVYEREFVSERSHNAQVFAPLAEALEVLGSEPARIVVGTGPGSYTGVRIAIAAAQGVALARGWPVLGLPTLVGAAGARVIGDARRGQFYTAEVSAAGEVSGLALLSADAARTAVEAGGVWCSFDPRPPLGLENLRLLRPEALPLARLAAAMDEATLATHAALPLEPLYLQEAFITTARKAGKHVPAQTVP